MSASARRQPVVRFLLRNYVEVLTVFALLFVLQTGFVPFDFAVDGAAPEPRDLFGTPASPLTFPDVVSNIFLYVPIGMLLHWSLCRRGVNRSLALITTVGLAAVVSGVIEWIQAYSPARVSSLLDWIANGVGASLGASVSWLARRVLPGLFEAVIDEFRRRPQATILKAYCFLLVVFAAIPFSFSFDVVRLKRAVKSANLVPFAFDEATHLTDEGIRGADAPLADEYLSWQRLKRWSRWAAECASFAVLAWLLHAVLRMDYGFGRRATAVLLWYFGGGLALMLSALQFVVVSRTCDVTDVVFRLLGLGVGLAARAIYLPDRENQNPISSGRRWQGLARVCLALTAAYILYTGLIPLTFDVRHSDPGAAVASESFLPFFAYFLSRFDLMMADAMEKFASYAVLAALLTLCWPGAGRLDAKGRVLRIVGFGMVLSGLIELAQLFLPVRVPSLTDPILAGVGCLTGALAQQHLVRLYRFALSPAAASPEPVRNAPAMAGRMPPSDVLIASLMEPQPGAPAEPSPKRTRRPQQ